MRTNRFLMAAAASLLFAASASADVIVPNATWTGGWTPANDGGEYWDRLSDDGTSCNIGFFIAGAAGPGFGPCVNQSGSVANGPNAVLEFLNDGTGAAQADVYFTSTDPQQATFLLEVSGLSATNEFGIYKKGDATSKVTLFVGADSPTSAAFFNPASLGWSDYGFFLKGEFGYFFYTESSLNVEDPNAQHFAFFRRADGFGGYEYFIGSEDRTLGASDSDYNDIVVRVGFVPEPGSLILLGSGLLGIGTAVRRRYSKKA